MVCFDIGCGGGLNTLYAASIGCEAIGVDVAHAGLTMARQRARDLPASSEPGEGDASIIININKQTQSAHDQPMHVSFEHADFLDLSSSYLQSVAGSADLIVDVQTWHAVRRSSGSQEERQYLQQACRLLKPGGHMLVVCGNSDDSDSDCAVSEAQIQIAFGETPCMHIVSMHADQFDPTPAYGSTPPRCWIVELERTLVEQDQ